MPCHIHFIGDKNGHTTSLLNLSSRLQKERTRLTGTEKVPPPQDEQVRLSFAQLWPPVIRMPCFAKETLNPQRVRLPCALCPVPSAWCPELCAQCLVPCAYCLVLCARCLVPGALCLVLAALCSVPGALGLVLCTLCPVPCALVCTMCLVPSVLCPVLCAWCPVLCVLCPGIIHQI